MHHSALVADRAVSDRGASDVLRPRATWIRALSEHYAAARRAHPDDQLCIVFDIDGTILDLRHLAAHTLLAYDRTHGTEHFRGLVADDVTQHEDRIDDILVSLETPMGIRSAVASFYLRHLWDRDAVLAASRPYPGVLEIIRWFQVQPDTHVALNTGRPHALRAVTVESMERVGGAARVRFDPDLLFTRAPGHDVPSGKVAAIETLRRRGFRVIAVLDNEPENLRAMAANDHDGAALFLHADTISRSRPTRHARLVSGRDYHVRDLVPQRVLPERVELVWHGVNDEANLEAFLGSDVRWAEVDLRHDPYGRLTLRHDGFDESPWSRSEPMLDAESAIRRLAVAGRSVKLDLKEGGSTIAEAERLVGTAGLDGTRLWFNAEVPTLGPAGFRRLRSHYPEAPISSPAEFLLPIVRADTAAACGLLEQLSSWGISRLSFRWGEPLTGILEVVEALGWQTNLYAVPDLESFLHACLLHPTSVTADFDFPEWRYHGRGSGARTSGVR